MPDAEIPYLWRPAREGSYNHGRNLPIQSIILHSSCGHKAGDLPTLEGHDASHLVSAHWYVDKQGVYYHLVQNKDTAWHVGAVSEPRWSNSASIGIEQEHLDGELLADGTVTGGEPWPDVQVQATARLCVALEQRLGHLAITHHSIVAVPHGRKTDPVGFPSEVFWAAWAEATRKTWVFVEAGA